MPQAPFDLERLDPAARSLWDENFAAEEVQAKPGVVCWWFGYRCMADLGRMPEVVSECLQELDPSDGMRRYLLRMGERGSRDGG